MIKLAKTTNIDLTVVKSQNTVTDLFIPVTDSFERREKALRAERMQRLTEQAHKDQLEFSAKKKALRIKFQHEYENLLPQLTKPTNLCSANYTDQQGRKAETIWISNRKELKGIAFGRYANLRMKGEIAIKFHGSEDFE